jgi:DNA polymerase I-like protein with 3'-5' exonuclease and polymerase domains
LSIDIETIRPSKSLRDTLQFEGHMYTIAIAPSSNEALALQLWNWNPQQRRVIWTRLNDLLRTKSVIGQNYFQFDTHYQEAYGLEPLLEQVHDTRLRHHILWPELPHSLQFQTRQYTRQKYYKDEGKTWSPKQLTQLLNYNALDTLVTYKIFEEQEKEFDERPHLI